MTSDTARRVRRALDGDRTVTVTRNFPLDDIRVMTRAEGGDGRTVTAYAAVFNDPTEIWDQDGHYLEQIHPNGFHNTLQQRRNSVFCVYNHAKNLSGGPSDLWSVPVGVPLPGSEGIRTDAKGLLTVTRYNQDEASSRILEAIKSGSLTGMSFTGVFLRSDPELTGPWSEYGPNKLGELPLVTRMEIALIEYGATPIPAYDHAQVVGVRARQEAEGRESVTLLTPDVIRAMNAAAGPAEESQDRALTAASTPQMAQGQQPMIHPDVKATPEHDTAGVLVTPDTAQEAKWDSQQWENAMQFPADLEHMHSLYALYDTSGQFADGTFAKSSGHLPHHVVDGNGAPGPHHPDAVKQALETLPALPVTDEQRDAARKHLQAHLDAEARSETDQDPPGETGATNGSGTNTLVSAVPTSSSGRDEDQGSERDGQARPEVWDAQMRAADEYAAAVLEITGDGPEAAAAFARAIMGQLAAGRAWDPDHDGDNDSDPAGDTDHDFFDADGAPRPKLSAEGRGGDAPGDGSKPYGNVHYADPGLQKDGKKRYPVDTKDHAESAWEFISEEANAGKYSAGDLAKVKAAIKAACKKFGVATSEDGDAGGKNATSSSGRQPAAEDQQTRTGDGDAETEGTGPPAERADAAPLTHPATDDDTSSSNRSMTMDGPMKVADRQARVTAIQERMTAIHALHPDGDVPEDLDTEFKGLGEEMSRHNAAIKDASERAQMVAAFTSARDAGGEGGSAHTETVANPGFADSGAGGGDGGGEAGQRSKFTGAPNFIPSVDRSQLYDLDAVKQSARNYTDLPRAYRDRAMKILEVDGRGFPQVRFSPPGEPHKTQTLTMEDAQTRVATLLDTIDDEHGSLARRIMVTGNPTYERAFGKAMSHLSIVGLDDAESRALALGVDAQGGYAVPFQLDPTVILTSNGAINPLRHLARVETITGKEWDGVTSAGVTVTRATEGTEVGTGDAAFTQPSVRTTRVQGFVPFSVELDVSWGALRSQMTALLMDAKDIEEATAFVSGSGTGANPTGLITGITNATAGTASTVTTAGTAALAVGDLYALENAMPARFRQQSAYLASRTTYNRFRQLFQALASAAFDSWVRPSGGQPATFNGYPAYELSTMGTTITSGSQVLVQGDYRQFLIVDRVGMGIELVPHLFGGTNRYPTGQRGILAIWFNSSQVLVPNAFRLLATT
jgi:HK97 family phage major capsid protein/HK97 family phage prohead protease